MSAAIASLILILIITVCIITIWIMSSNRTRSIRNEVTTATPVSTGPSNTAVKETITLLRSRDFTSSILSKNNEEQCTIYSWSQDVSYTVEGVDRARPVTAPRTCLFPNEAQLSKNTLICQEVEQVSALFPQALSICYGPDGEIIERGGTTVQYQQCGSLKPCGFTLVRISLKWNGSTDKSNCITVGNTQDDPVGLKTCVAPNIFSIDGENQTFIVESVSRTFGNNLPSWIALKSININRYLAVSSSGTSLTYSTSPYYFLTLPAVSQQTLQNGKVTTINRAQTLGYIPTVTEGNTTAINGTYSPAIESSSVYAYNAPAVIEENGKITIIRPSRYGAPQLSYTGGLNIIVL